MTLDFGCPFEVTTKPFRIKQDNRALPLCGIQVHGVKASVAYPDHTFDIMSIVNGAGLAQNDADPLLEHSTETSHMWCSEGNESVKAIEFDLGQACRLGLIKVWNYNHVVFSRQGLKQADLSVWTQDKGWQVVEKAIAFQEAEGTTDYDDPALITLPGVMAQRVRFENLVGLTDVSLIGLSEVQFYEARTRKACNPTPGDGGRLGYPGSSTITWMPGLEAVSHRLYMGFSEDALSFVGDIKGRAEAQIAGLCPDHEYYWRVDQVHKNGGATTGKLWRFSTNRLVARYSLDETQGGDVADASGNGLNAKAIGEPVWKDEGGKRGGVLSFDGQDDYVDLPDAVGSHFQALTFSLWAYPTSNAHWARFIEFGNGPMRDNVEFARQADLADLIFVMYGEAGEQGRVIAKDVIVNNQWQHFAVTVDVAGNVKLYKNGQAQVLEDQTNVGLVCNTVRRLNYIGKSLWGGDDELYRGMMDDVRIYNAALEPSEIRAIYNGQEIHQPTSDHLPRLLTAAK
jgi:hypothetical protein